MFQGKFPYDFNQVIEEFEAQYWVAVFWLTGGDRGEVEVCFSSDNVVMNFCSVRFVLM